MTSYLSTHSLQGDIRRVVRWAIHNRVTMLTVAASVAIAILCRRVAVYERLARGYSKIHAVGGEAFAPALPWLVRVIWESVREVIPW